MATKTTQRSGPERRFLQSVTAETAPATAEGDGSLITGYAATFGQVADLWWFEERILPGAFEESAAADDVVFVFNHSWDQVLGRTASGTLRLSEDEIGLRYELDLPDTSLGRDLRELVKRGDLRSMSFSFDALEETVHHDLEKPLRELKKVKLYDVSLVTYPAYEGTSVDLRSAAQAKAEAWLEEQRKQKQQQSDQERLRRLRMRVRAL